MLNTFYLVLFLLYIMTTFPIYWITPWAWTIDTSFEQGSGFDKLPNWIKKSWDNYVVLWWTNWYSVYNGISSINANFYIPFFRVSKTNNQTYFYDSVGSNINSTNNLINENIAVIWEHIYLTGFFTNYWNNKAQHIVKINKNDMSFNLWNTWVWYSSASSVKIRQAWWKLFIARTSDFTYNWWPSSRLHVINTDLTEDTTLTNFFSPNNQITFVFEQSDWKVIISWSFTSIWWTTQNRIVRYNTDWTVDTTFTTNVWTWPSAWAIDIKQLSDWKLVLWWSFTTFNGTASQRVIILNTDWTIATAVASWFSSWQVNSIAIDWSDNIFCWWTFSLFAWNTRVALAKLSSTLILDATRLPVMSSWTQVYSLWIDTDNLYIWTGNARTTNWITVNGVFSTDLVNGTLISNFVWWVNGNVRSIYVDSNDIFIYSWARPAKYWGNYTFWWEKTSTFTFLNKNGLLLKNYDNFENSWSYDAIQYHKDWTDEYLTVSANTNYWLLNTKWVAKISNWKIDYSYIANISSTVFTSIYDNGIIIWWNFTSPKNRIVKLDSTWWVDSSFDVWTGFGNNSVLWITLLSTGKYLVTGTFTTYKWVTQNKIVVLNSDWSVDSSFVVWTWPSSWCKSYELQDWNYLLWWSPSDWTLTTWKWTACNSLIKVSPTWDIIPFLSNNITWTTIYDCLEYNWKIYVFGNMTNDWVNTVSWLACYELDWTPVNIFWTFTATTWTPYITWWIVDSEWKLVVVWNFTSYNGNTVWNVVRLFI